ncbi:MAG: virulence factor [Desulfosporosinus sp.]|nr:virulence factor [Desulfosporosinus sp.]
MTNESFIYSFKVIGFERKQIASNIAEALGEEVKYQGPPTFAYLIAGWRVDRNGVVTSPEIEDNKILRTVLEALKTAGVIPEGNGTVTLPLNDHDGNSLRNTVNIIWSKQKLIQKALDWQASIIPAGLVNAINAVPIDSLEEFAEAVNKAIDAGAIEEDSQLEFDLIDKSISFSFFNAILNIEEVLAYRTLCQLINEQGRKQKFSSTNQREVINEKYAFRVWLLKLGFIGEIFKTERKILLSKLDGDAAYRTIEAKQAAGEKRKALR